MLKLSGSTTLGWWRSCLLAIAVLTMTTDCLAVEPPDIMLQRGERVSWTALYVPDCQSDQECCESIPYNKAWIESFGKEPPGLAKDDVGTVLRMHDDTLLYPQSFVWTEAWDGWPMLKPLDALRARRKRLEKAKTGSHNRGVIVVLDCLDTRPETDDERQDKRIPQPFANSREPSLMFLMPHWPAETVKNGPWWFYCDPGAELVEESVPIWPWLQSIQDGKNIRTRRSCIRSPETEEEEIKVEVHPRSTKCLEADPYTFETIKLARVENRANGRGQQPIASRFVHVTLHDLRNFATNPAALATFTTTASRSPFDDALPTEAKVAAIQAQNTRTIRACLQNLNTRDVELAVTIKRKTLAEYFAEDEP